jgi:hypothetical protein
MKSKPHAMDYPKEGSTSLYDYSDKSVPQAGYAAIVYAVVSTLSAGLAWFRAPSTPWIAIVIVALVIGLFFGALAFGIFRKSRVAVVIMLVFVIGLQLYTWFLMRSASGTPYRSSSRAFCCAALVESFRIMRSEKQTSKKSNQAMPFRQVKVSPPPAVADLIDSLMLLVHSSGLTPSLPLTRPLGLPIYVARVPAAPFPSMSRLGSPFHSR